MLAKRVLVVLALLPIGLAVVALGGPVFIVFVSLVIGLAAWEYERLFRASGAAPAGAVLIGGAVLLVLGRGWDGFESAGWLLPAAIMAAMTIHLLAYERGRTCAATDFAVTLSGTMYLGWMGAYLVSLRFLPGGLWWLLHVLFTVWLVDVGAYLIGKRFGRRRLSPRLSPKKTWEGYFGGLGSGFLGGVLVAAAFSAVPGPQVTLGAGAVIGLLIGLLTPLGDLGESMIKRQAGAKDSGTLLPGHGGIFDRIDSWLWAAPISYYLIVWFFI